MKANEEFRSSRNEENKIAKNEINEILREEDEGQHNKSLHINRVELKDNDKKKVEEKLWNIKWKEVKNGKQEWLWLLSQIDRKI